VPAGGRQFDLKLGCDVIERAVGGWAEPYGTTHALNDLRSPGQLDTPVLDEDHRAVGEKVQIVVLEFFQAALKLNRFQANQNILIRAKRRGAAALVVHQGKRVVGRGKRWVKICLVSIEERIRGWERLHWNVGPFLRAIRASREGAVRNVAMAAGSVVTLRGYIRRQGNDGTRSYH